MTCRKRPSQAPTDLGYNEGQLVALTELHTCNSPSIHSKMSSSARLDLQLEEPGDDPLSDQVFDIIRNTLQPDSELPLETAVKEIAALLPEGKPCSSEVGTFLETCYEVTDQIPYSHPSMAKLTTLVYSTLNFVWQSQIDKVGENAQDTPYQRLVETLRDWWNSRSSSDKTS
jgi:hypothetical protein